MKLSRYAFVTFWDVHAWSGVLISLVVYVMFVGGTFTVFYGQLQAWQDPPAAAVDEAMVDAAAARVAAEHGLAGKELDVALPGKHGHPRPQIGFFDGKAYQEHVVGEDGALAPPTSAVAKVLYWMHFLYHEDFPEGFYIAGLFGVAYLLALITGLLIHLKDLGRQLFQFRPHDRTRMRASDLHKVLGVWGLPFQLVIAFTGAVICLAAVVTPYAARPAFGDENRGATELYGNYALPEPAGRPGAMLAPSALAARAEAAVPGLDAWWVRLGPYGDENAQAFVYGDVEGRLSPRVIVRVRAHDGEVIGVQDGGGPALATMKTFTGLHFAAYGGLALRFVYFLLGLGGCVTILSGNWIWLARWAARRQSCGDLILARLTVGVGAGLPLAIACMLSVNRLLPPTADRGAIEAWTMFGALGAIVLACLVARPTRMTWSILLGAAGVAFAAIPLLSMLTRSVHLFDRRGPLAWHIVGVDLGLAVLGAILLAVAIALVRRRAQEIAT